MLVLQTWICMKEVDKIILVEVPIFLHCLKDIEKELIVLEIANI